MKGAKLQIFRESTGKIINAGIIYYGSDVKSASSLLGHSSLAYTDRYVRVVEKLKEKAVENLPEVTMTL